MTTISRMVQSMLNKYEAARNSDEALLDVILMHYFHNDIELFMEGRPVQFINGMTRDRRRLQML
jgi:hypothetical protein